MSFRELLNAYRDGALDEDARREVEEAIDREDALLEYLAEREEIPEPADGDDVPAPHDEQDARLEARFRAELTRRIRRAFVKLGVCVGAVLLAVLLLIQFVLPHAVARLYYNPGETAAVWKTDTWEYSTNRMSLDLAVYSELFLPGAYRENVQVIDRGYGDYDLVIVQNLSVNGRFTDVGGHISRGRLILYDRSVLKPPVDNSFEWGVNMPDPARSLSAQIRPPETDADGVITHYAVGMAGYPEEARTRLTELPEGVLYQGFVSLDRVMDYESLYTFLQTQGLDHVWCAVQLAEKPGYAANCGFDTYLGNGGNILCWDEVRYPALKRNELDARAAADSVPIRTAEQAETHLCSLLRYLQDQTQFCAMMGGDLNGFDPAEALRYLEANGVWVYGFAVTADRSVLLALQDAPEVYSVAVQPLP